MRYDIDVHPSGTLVVRFGTVIPALSVLPVEARARSAWMMSSCGADCGRLTASPSGSVTVAGQPKLGAGALMGVGSGPATGMTLWSGVSRLSAASIRADRLGEPQPVGKSQPGVAGSGLAPSVMSWKAVAPAGLWAIL